MQLLSVLWRAAKRQTEVKRDVHFGAASFAALGFIKYNGTTAEKFIYVWLKSEFLKPKKLTFRSTNLYYELLKPSMETKIKESLVVALNYPEINLLFLYEIFKFIRYPFFEIKRKDTLL